MPENDHLINSGESHRGDRIQKIVNECLVQRAAGDAVTDESLIKAHPELLPELADELEKLRLIQQAKRNAKIPAPTRAAEGLRIRCPHCQNPVEVVEDSSLSGVNCPSCGSQFSLVDDADRSYQAGQLEYVNHFQLLDKLGVGAFGSVWSAKDTQLDRIVALKIPRKGQMSPEDQEQFIREARAAAQLKHPNIVSVLEVGRHDDRIYIACEFVQGLDLADWLTDQQATPREAAELCATLADALQHAHDHGVIHRDIKPSNIMLDLKGEPHLMDFGLAKREAGEMTMTVAGKLLGTPAYMPPEQARGAAHDADARSDVYSLGVILFELLTSERPFRGNSRMLLHQVLLEDPPSPRKLNSQVPKDLETICLKCLEKEAGCRYQTAGMLRDDLRRFLRGEPVWARPISRLARSWRWSKRRPALASLLALMSILATFGPLIAIRMNALATAEAAARQHADQARADVQKLLYTSDMTVAQVALGKANVAAVVQMLERHRPATGEKDLRGFEWYMFWKACQRFIMARTPINGYMVDAKFSQDGRTLFLQSADGIVEHRSVPSLELLRRYLSTYDGREDRVWSNGNLSPDGLISIVGRIDGLGFHELEKGTERFLELDGRTGGVASPDGKSYAAVNEFGNVIVGDLHTSSVRFSKHAHDDAVYCTAFSSDSQRLATGGRDEQLKLWNATTGELICEIDVGEICSEKSSVSSVCFSPDGRWIAAGTSGDFRVSLWDSATGALVADLGQHQSFVTSLCFAPQGSMLASGARFIRIWDTETGQLVDELRSDSSETVRRLVFSPNGETLYAASGDGLRRWNLNERANPSVFRSNDSFRVGALSTNGRLYAAAGNGDEIMVVDVETLRLKARLPHADVFSLALKDDKWLASGSRDGQVLLWDLDRETLIQHVGNFGPSQGGLAFSPRDNTLAIGTDTGLRLWNVERHQPIRIVIDEQPVSRICFSPNGDLVAGRVAIPNKQDRHGYVWEVASGLLRFKLEADIDSIEFSPDGSKIITGVSKGQVIVWSSATGKKQFLLSGLNGDVDAVAASADGKTILGAAFEEVGFWDVETRQLRFRLAGHQESVVGVASTNDLRTLVTASVDDTIRVWRAATPQEVAELSHAWHERKP